VRIRAVSAVTPEYPRTVPDFPYLASDSWATRAPASRTFRESLAYTAYEQAGLGPEDVDLAEVYDLTTAMELDWYEETGLCAPGGAEKLLHSGATALGGRVPVNASGGLSSFGEAVPAQALAQVCELTWQLRGEAGARQVAGARVGLAVNQGLFGHGSAIVLAGA
jgi:acetyl-CoA acetyltransferase